ncbi:MAG: T9SS type A sorting domain-containing protein [Candidatus Fermentibacteria bacterium]
MRVSCCNWEGQALVPYLIAEVDSVNSTAVLTYNVFGNNQYDLYRVWQGTSSSQLAPLFLTPERQSSIWELPTGWNYFAVSALDSNQAETGLSNIDSVFVIWTGISSENDTDTSASLLFPNPARSNVNLLLNSAENGIIEIKIFDITGRTVLSTGLSLFKQEEYAEHWALMICRPVCTPSAYRGIVRSLLKVL